MQAQIVELLLDLSQGLRSLYGKLFLDCARAEAIPA